MNRQKNKTRIFLIGYMGSGKSTLGKQLAHKLGYRFLDTDQLFEDNYHKTIFEFFSLYGEEKFRQLERQILHETFEMSKTVISTGGGTPSYSNNMDSILNHGLSIYLRMDPGALYSRLKSARRIRPLTHQFKDEQLLEFIQKNLEQRKQYYEKADIVISGINLKSKDLETIVRYYLS
ncbi:MAG: shikimate kinase [Bacteroidales bacterium]